MSAWLDAVARVFVAPPATAAPVAAAPAVAMPAMAFCGPAAEPLACAAALLLRRRGPVVVCTWGGGARGPELPATAGARRLARSLCGRGLAARATGRVVAVALDAHAPVAAAEAGRAGAASGDAPVVIALCGPRDDAFDALLAAQDVAVVAAGPGPEEVARIGVCALGAVAPAAVALPSLSLAAAWGARAGGVATPAARRALAPALAALGRLP